MEKSWFSTTFSHKEHKFKQSPVGKSLCGGPGFRERSPHVTLKKKMISKIRYTEEVQQSRRGEDSACRELPV